MGLEEKNKIVNKLISLNIDPVFVLRTRHGIVFNTIVKNVESTLKKTVDDVLNWKLTNMFVICDPVKSKHFLQKLSTMQSLSPRIKTQIYYSKLYVKNQTLSTFGVELTLSMLSQRTLCGINLYKSIDELLKMEKSSNVYVIQYKVLTYEQGQTFELINGPRSTVTNTRLKTAFDFDASYNGFPRQVLPLAIIEFQCSSDNFYNVINRYFENVEHCQFDSSLLITTTDSDEEELIVEKENNEITEHTVQQEEIIESVIRDDISCSVSPYSFKEVENEKFLPQYRNCYISVIPIDLSLYDITNKPTIIRKEKRFVTHSTENKITSIKKLTASRKKRLKKIQNNTSLPVPMKKMKYPITKKSVSSVMSAVEMTSEHSTTSHDDQKHIKTIINDDCYIPLIRIDLAEYGMNDRHIPNSD